MFQAETEMRQRAELIQQIRAIESMPIDRWKPIDLTTVPGHGVHDEMSIAELYERLELIKLEREKERELIVAIQSQHQANNCLFNGHPSTSGHSSPTNQSIDTNNNPTTNSSSTYYSSSTAVTPPPPPLSIQNAASNLDPNAQDFCLPTHSTNTN